MTGEVVQGRSGSHCRQADKPSAGGTMPLKAVTIFVEEERYANRLASFATHASPLESPLAVRPPLCTDPTAPPHTHSGRRK